MDGRRGQGTIEYLAVVLVVALVLAAITAVTLKTGLGQRVVAAIHQALCIVTGGCDQTAGPDASACVRASEQQVDGAGITLLVARFEGREVLLREERADGTVAITLADERAAGVDGGTGAGARVRWGQRSFAVGSELRAAVLAGSGSGRTWIAPDAAAADRLVDRVRRARLAERPEAAIETSEHYAGFPTPRRREVRAPDADVTFSQRTGSLAIDFRGSGRAVVELSTDDAYGERLDHASGRRTVYVDMGLRGQASVGLARGASVQAAGEVHERFAITYDREGRPLQFAVLSALDVDGAAGLPPRLARIAGRLGVPLRGARHVETEQLLDLSDPLNAEAAQAFLAAAHGDRPALVLAANALRARLDEVGSASVRSYRTQSSAHGVGGRLKVAGIGLGGNVGREEGSARLQSAVARQPDGTWAADPACTAAT